MSILLLIGIAIISGLIGGKISHQLRSPAVVGYILIGLILGPSILGLFKLDLLDRMGVISDLALGLIAFIIGSHLPLGLLRRMGKQVVIPIHLEFFSFLSLRAEAKQSRCCLVPIEIASPACAPACGRQVPARRQVAIAPRNDTICSSIIEKQNL